MKPSTMRLQLTSTHGLRCPRRLPLRLCDRRVRIEQHPTGHQGERTCRRKPEQILKASAAALRSVGSFVMQGTMTQLSTPKQRMRISLEFYSTHAFLMQMSMKAGSFAMISWQEGLHERGREVPGNHVHITRCVPICEPLAAFPVSAVGSLTSGLHQMQPAQIQPHGSYMVVSPLPGTRQSRVSRRSSCEITVTFPAISPRPSPSRRPVSPTRCGSRRPGSSVRAVARARAAAGLACRRTVR